MFDLWINQAREHWKEHQPTRFRELKKAVMLDEALKAAAEQTHLEMSQLEEQGYRNHEAWEIVREKYLFPPQEPGVEEDDEPNPWTNLRRDAIQLQNEVAREFDESWDP